MHNVACEFACVEKMRRSALKAMLGKNQRFFAVALSKIDLHNVDTWKM